MNMCLRLLPMVLLMAACAAPTGGSGSGSSPAASGLPAVPAGHIGVYGQLSGEKAGYRVFAFSDSTHIRYEATIDASGHYVAIVPENSGRMNLLVYHDQNGNGALDQGEYYLGGALSLFAYQEDLTGWNFTCLPTRTLTATVTVPSGLVPAGTTFTVDASDPMGVETGASSPSLAANGTAQTLTVSWEVPSDRPLFIDISPVWGASSEVAQAFRTAPLLPTDSPSVNLTFSPYQARTVSGTITMPAGTNAGDVKFEFFAAHGKSVASYGVGGGATSTGPTTATYSLTVPPGFHRAGAVVGQATLANNAYGWYGGTSLTVPAAFLVVDQNRPGIDITISAATTATLTVNYTLPSGAPALNTFVEYSLWPEFPQSVTLQATSSAGTLSIPVPANYPIDKLRIDWTEPSGGTDRRFYVLKSLESPITVAPGQTTDLGSVLFVEE